MQAAFPAGVDSAVLYGHDIGAILLAQRSWIYITCMQLLCLSLTHAYLCRGLEQSGKVRTAHLDIAALSGNSLLCKAPQPIWLWQVCRQQPDGHTVGHAPAAKS